MEPLATQQKIEAVNVDMDQDTILFMISLIEERSCIWNRKNSGFQNKTKQHDAWREISVILDTPVDCLVRKWKSLCGSFRFYHAKEQKSKVTGSSSSSIYKPKWFAYRAMHFMHHVKETASTMDTLFRTIQTA
ncbi:uncharacterized protein LOC121601006 [Anopheles merus]|uniref:uncharacterized protein LOC121588385 n=1 Tax=Anopheles merus TaxID=30066 RepID=UPI001BE41299|nr:uncharacterized protein LOC121588385 [Anopheles merus]XP_041785724.1 uncharacterized protein LOC121601006 [Anopheles merus]